MRIIKTGIITTIIIIFFLVCITCILAGVGIFSLEKHPLVSKGKKLTPGDIESAKHLVEINDPRKLKAGTIKDLSITEHDLNLLLSYGIDYTKFGKKLNSAIDVRANSAIINLTLTVPKNTRGTFLNISTALAPSLDVLTIQKVNIGKVQIPHWLIKPIWNSIQNSLLKRFEVYGNVADAYKAIKHLRMEEDALILTYQWKPEVMNQLKAQGRKILLSDIDNESLLAYYNEISSTSHTISSTSHTVNMKSVSLDRFLKPLFLLARERTRVNGNPIAENKSAILALAIYISGKSIDTFAGNIESKERIKPRKVKLTLRKRHDLAQHFVISSCVSVTAGKVLADALGLFKELDDSKGGSGFSFADLAADQAGVRFAKFATDSTRNAGLLQQKMSAVLSESEFMPPIDKLPEKIMELEFKRQYQDIDSRSFQIVNEEIDRRINTCPIYQ
jgi:hypothetical protein